MIKPETRLTVGESEALADLVETHGQDWASEDGDALIDRLRGKTPFPNDDDGEIPETRISVYRHETDRDRLVVKATCGDYSEERTISRGAHGWNADSGNVYIDGGTLDRAVAMHRRDLIRAVERRAHAEKTIDRFFETKKFVRDMQKPIREACAFA